MGPHSGTAGLTRTYPTTDRSWTAKDAVAREHETRAIAREPESQKVGPRGAESAGRKRWRPSWPVS
jgi:hypothetical protein